MSLTTFASQRAGCNAAKGGKKCTTVTLIDTLISITFKSPKFRSNQPPDQDYTKFFSLFLGLRVNKLASKNPYAALHCNQPPFFITLLWQFWSHVTFDWSPKTHTASDLLVRQNLWPLVKNSTASISHWSAARGEHHMRERPLYSIHASHLSV